MRNENEELVNEQMQRFMGKIAAGELNHLSLCERGLLYTLIGKSAEEAVIGEVEDSLPDSKDSLRRHLNALIDEGYVMLAPTDAGKQISKKHYSVNI